MKPILFIHIPKTAGTSLNASAEASLGKEAIEKDYGAAAPHTSPLVREYIYDTDTLDQFGFFQALQNQRRTWLTGHFNADRYIQFAGCENTVSVVREPVERVISEYLYRRREGTTEQSLQEFYRSPAETNKQYCMLGQFPWQAFHFVGTQERYRDCLKFLSGSLDMPFTLEEKNRRPDQSGLQISDAVKTDIAAWNERDSLFYQDVCRYLDAQLAAQAEGKPFCYHDVGFVAGQHAIGWAFYGDDNSIADVELWVDGQQHAKVRASEYRAELAAIGAPRQGCVGFRFVLESLSNARHVEIRASMTQQTLYSWASPASLKLET